eukprot:3304825-Alexandrium_andersonii.AAC.1
MAWTLWLYSPPSAAAASDGARALHKAAAACIEPALAASFIRFLGRAKRLDTWSGTWFTTESK